MNKSIVKENILRNHLSMCKLHMECLEHDKAYEHSMFIKGPKVCCRLLLFLELLNGYAWQYEGLHKLIKEL